MSHFPPELFHHIHRYCDIDTRRNLERSLGISFIAYPLPFPKIDYAKVKKEAAEVEYDPDYPSQSVFTISISGMSTFKTYDIEIMIRSPWIRSSSSGKWKMESQHTFSSSKRGHLEEVSV